MRTAWQTSRVDTQQQHVRELVTVHLSAHAHTAARVRTGNAYHTPRSALQTNVKRVSLGITLTGSGIVNRVRTAIVNKVCAHTVVT
jgi:hypothetical protein